MTSVSVPSFFPAQTRLRVLLYIVLAYSVWLHKAITTAASTTYTLPDSSVGSNDSQKRAAPSWAAYSVAWTAPITAKVGPGLCPSTIPTGTNVSKLLWTSLTGNLTIVLLAMKIILLDLA